MLVSKIKPCLSQYKLLQGEPANGSIKQLSFLFGGHSLLGFHERIHVVGGLAREISSRGRSQLQQSFKRVPKRCFRAPFWWIVWGGAWGALPRKDSSRVRWFLVVGSLAREVSNRREGRRERENRV